MTGSLLPAANLFGAGGIVRLADFLRTMWI